MGKKIMAVILTLSILFTCFNAAGFNNVSAAETGAGSGDKLGNANAFLLANQSGAAAVFVDSYYEEISSGGGYEYCGLEIIANKFADDVKAVTNQRPKVISEASQMSGNVVIAGTIGHNEVIDSLISNGKIDASGLYKNGELKWDCYQMQFVSGTVLAECGYQGVEQALVITGSNKRGAMYGLFNISEHIGVSAWVYMADAVPSQYSDIYLDAELLEFNGNGIYLANEPSVKYRGFFINDESPSFTGWAKEAFGGVNENCYENIFELIIRMKANYLWPAMWSNNFSEEGKEFKLANVVLADAYGVCMGTSHHEACCRAGVEWQRIYRNYGTSNEWNYDTNKDAIYNFWKDGVARNGDYESTITMGMRGEADTKLDGGVEYNINLLKDIITDQNEIIDSYISENPDSKAKDALKIYVPYSENEGYYYGTDDGSIAGLNVWEGMDDVTVVLTDDNYGNVRSLPEESVRYRDAGWGLYYHLDGHVGPYAYEWVSSTQLEHIWDQLTMAYDYNVRQLWVVNVGDIKPVEMEINYAMDIAYDMEKWGQNNTAETYRKEWLKKQLGGEKNCSDEAAEKAADCVADFLKISTYRKPEKVDSTLYSNVNYDEAQEVLDLCIETIDEANYCYDKYFKGTLWDDAYYQIVYYQAVATANVTMMQIYKSLNKFYKGQNSSLANVYASLIDECVEYDKELTDYYNNGMSNGKWKKMMSSPHVGFIHWNSEGWSYPEGETIELKDEPGMLVTADGYSKAYEEGEIKLQTFTNTMKQRYCITLSNSGNKPYDFTVGTRADWLQITDKDGKEIVNGGTVDEAAYFYISVDWSRVRSEKMGTVVIKGNGQTVKLIVNTEYTEYKSKGVGTHFESNDVVVIDGDEYINNVSSNNGVKWSSMDGCGRYKTAMKMFPTTKSFAIRTGDTIQVTGGKTTRTETVYKENYEAPYMEYKIYVDEDDNYTITLYSTPTNNIYKPFDWGYVPVELFYGVQVDDGFLTNVNSLPAGKYVSYSADGDNRWRDGVFNNIHVSASEEYMTAGVHTIKIYGVQPGLGVERLVISNKEIKESYLGPEKTFMLDYDIIPEQKAGVHYEAAAGALNYGAPDNLEAITDADDVNDPADPVEIETPIPSPVKPDTPSVNPGADVQVNPPAAASDNSGNKAADVAGTVKAGTTFTYKKCRYKITKATKKGGNVTFMSPVKKNVKKIVIPAKVKWSGGLYNVTSINKKAFKNCSKLKNIVIKSKNIKKVGKNCFKGVDKKVKVKVPKTMVKRYKKLFKIKNIS